MAAFFWAMSSQRSMGLPTVFSTASCSRFLAICLLNSSMLFSSAARSASTGLPTRVEPIIPRRKLIQLGPVRPPMRPWVVPNIAGRVRPAVSAVMGAWTKSGSTSATAYPSPCLPASRPPCNPASSAALRTGRALSALRLGARNWPAFIPASRIPRPTAWPGVRSPPSATAFSMARESVGYAIFVRVEPGISSISFMSLALSYWSWYFSRFFMNLAKPS